MDDEFTIQRFDGYHWVDYHPGYNVQVTKDFGIKYVDDMKKTQPFTWRLICKVVVHL